ncbi:hypothetical protein Tco_0694491 [Tanacetum coccineum]|uniref:Secreted protein n=1 Tax=Tanacetum coccineum TaxID=301880 RepID=A0ABQ5GHA4_9ASTR
MSLPTPNRSLCFQMLIIFYFYMKAASGEHNSDDTTDIVTPTTTSNNTQKGKNKTNKNKGNGRGAKSNGFAGGVGFAVQIIHVVTVRRFFSMAKLIQLLSNSVMRHTAPSWCLLCNSCSSTSTYSSATNSRCSAVADAATSPNIPLGDTGTLRMLSPVGSTRK